MSNNDHKKQGKQFKNLAILSGITIQMGVTIYLFVVLGKWLDAKFYQGDKLFVIICTLLGVAISLYMVIKQVNRIKH